MWQIEIAKLKKRIEQLEDALRKHHLPISERICPCCDNAYLPDHYDSCRCEECTLSCCYKDGKWEHGRWCPLNRTKERNDV